MGKIKLKNDELLKNSKEKKIRDNIIQFKRVKMG